MIRYANLVKVNEAELALLAGEDDITRQRRVCSAWDLAVCGDARPGGQLFPVADGGEAVPGFRGGDGGRHRLRRRLRRRPAVATGQGRATGATSSRRTG